MQQITGQTGNGGTNDVEIVIRLKYLSNFWRALEMPLINFETTFQLTCSKKIILAAGTVASKVPTFKITLKLQHFFCNFINLRKYKTVKTIRIWF